MASKQIEAYWFAAGDTLPHGDGRKIILGKAHTIKGKLILCHKALHASREPFDALQYAPGPFLYKVLCSGSIIEHEDKLGCSRREYVAMIDATDLLRQFAREQALSVSHLWAMPDMVRQYLETGDETLRDAAYAAARDTAWDAWVVSQDTARDTAWAAARDAARNAWVVSQDTARNAARNAARDAAWAAARDAARNAAWDAARDAARKRFNELVYAAFQATAGAIPTLERMSKRPDFRIEYHGTITLLQPCTEACWTWLEDNVAYDDWQWFGNKLAIEPRYLDNLLQGLHDAGFSEG